MAALLFGQQALRIEKEGLLQVNLCLCMPKSL
jgi:hypothetical protein